MGKYFLHNYVGVGGKEEEEGQVRERVGCGGIGGEE